jgi:hypothetical protein
MVARHVKPIAAEIDETDRFPTELVKLYGEMGLMQLWIPEEYGGPNGNLTMMCIAREEISRVSPACGSIAGLNTMFIMPLLHFGTEEQRQRFLPQVAKGGVVTAIAIPSPRRARVGAMKTRAVRDGDSYVLNGRKQWCSYGVEADYIVVMARTSGDSGADGISAFVVEPKKMKGVTFGRHERKMGWRGAPNTPIFLDNVRVPVENLIGEEGKGFKASDARAGPEPPHHRRAVRRPGTGGTGRLRRIRQGAPPVQARDRRIPGCAVHAGRHGDQHRGGPRAGLRVRARGRQRRVGAPERAGQHGQVLRQRHGDARHHRRRAGLRRLRLHARLSRWNA